MTQPGDVVNTDPWRCLAQTPELPTPSGNLVAFVQPVLEWASRASMAGRGPQASLCTNLDVGCMSPLAGSYMVRPGMIGMTPLPPKIPAASAIPMPEAFDGFIKFEVMDPTAMEPQQFCPDDPDQQPFGRLQMGSVAGQLSFGPIRSAYVLGADVRGSTPIVNSCMN